MIESACASDLGRVVLSCKDKDSDILGADVEGGWTVGLWMAAILQGPGTPKNEIR